MLKLKAVVFCPSVLKNLILFTELKCGDSVHSVAPIAPAVYLMLQLRTCNSS